MPSFAQRDNAMPISARLEAGPLHRPIRPPSLTLQQLLNSETNVSSNLAKQGR
jgi:hypothetical protein